MPQQFDRNYHSYSTNSPTNSYQCCNLAVTLQYATKERYSRLSRVMIRSSNRCIGLWNDRESDGMRTNDCQASLSLASADPSSQRCNLFVAADTRVTFNPTRRGSLFLTPTRPPMNRCQEYAIRAQRKPSSVSYRARKRSLEAHKEKISQCIWLRSAQEFRLLMRIITLPLFTSCSP